MLRKAKLQGSKGKLVHSSGTGICTNHLEISQRNEALPVCMYSSQVTLVLVIFIDCSTDEASEQIINSGVHFAFSNIQSNTAFVDMPPNHGQNKA